MKSHSKHKTGIKCLKCGDRLFSYSRHDFKHCSCGQVFVDGGDDYMRVGGNEKNWKFIKKIRSV